MKNCAKKVPSIVFLILAISILVLNYSAKISSAESLDTVHFSDANMEAAVRSVLGKPSGAIYTNDLEKIYSLDLYNKNISDIDGIQYCVNLTTLGLRGNQLNDITPLNGLTKLTSLDLGNNNISNLNPLSKLVNLNSIMLDNNKIIDITPLENLSKVTDMSLDYNNISNIYALSGCPNLTALYLSNNQLNNVDSVKRLTKLTELDLSHNDLQDNSLNAITGLANLQTLYLDGNAIKSIAVLKNSPYLTSLKTIEIWGLTSNLKDRRFLVMENKISHILNDFISPDMTDVEKELALHDYLLANTEYSTDTIEGSLYSALVYGVGYCETYSEAMIDLLKMAGVEAKYIGGYGHGWNLVKLDGNYYHLDTTWDDFYGYTYFNLSDSEIKALRWGPMFDKPIEEAGIPCTSTNYDFLRYMLNRDRQNRSSIFLSGQWLYYADDNDGYSLYKVSLDGTNPVKLSSDKIANISVENDWVYYLNQSDNNLYKVKTDGTQKQLVTEPTVISTDPGRDVSNVSINKNLNIVFSKSIKLNSSGNSIALRDSLGQSVAITVNINNNVLSVSPVHPMQGTEEYNLEIPKGSIQDVDGNIMLQDYQLSFTTEEHTDIPLAVISSSPNNGSKDVAVDSSLNIKFNRSIRLVMVQGKWGLEDSNGNPVVIDINSSGDTLTIVPESRLSYNTTYNLVIPSKAILDLEDHQLLNDIKMSFTTGKEYYTINFYSSGGTPEANQSVEVNNKVVKPAVPSRTGYTFVGWYKDASYINPWNFNTDTVTNNLTLYAKWTINKYTVTFNSQGGSSEHSSTANYNSKITAPTKPTKAGYTFIGWYKEPLCKNAWDLNKDTVRSNTTLYAKWITSPTNVAAVSTGYNSIKISWKAVAGVSGYEIYKSTSTSGVYSSVTYTTSSNYTITGLTIGKTYYYKVRSYTTIGTTKVYSGYSSVVNSKPALSVPASVNLVRVNSRSIKISWSGVVGASGYEIYRSTSKTRTYYLIQTLTALHYTNSSLTKRRTYFYKIRAYRIVGHKKIYSNWTSIKSATV